VSSSFVSWGPRLDDCWSFSSATFGRLMEPQRPMNKRTTESSSRPKELLPPPHLPVLRSASVFHCSTATGPTTHTTFCFLSNRVYPPREKGENYPKVWNVGTCFGLLEMSRVFGDGAKRRTGGQAEGGEEWVACGDAMITGIGVC
jgi:hypothetical protein